jgi:hypothetical protein
MTDFSSILSKLSRPKQLIRAARFGTDGYVRKTALTRLLGASNPPTPQSAITKLLELEDIANAHRKAGSAEYSINRHIELLIAMMCEARLLRPRQQA